MRILVIDRDARYRQGMRTLLQQPCRREWVEVLEASNYDEAMALVAAHGDLTLVLIESRLAGASLFSALGELRERRPGLPVVVMAAEASPAVVQELFDCGARGLLPKSSAPQVIVAALRLVLSGGRYVPAEVMASAPTQARVCDDPHIVLGALGVTPRQSEVLALLVAGKSNKAISRELNLAEGTVKNYVAALLKTLGVGTRVQAVIAAGRLGLK